MKDVKGKAKKEEAPMVKLMFDHILTTAATRKATASGILLKDNKQNILTRQTVVACGPGSNVKVGDEVEIAPERFQKSYVKPKHDVGPDRVEIKVPIEVINDVPYLLISSRELKWVYV